MAGFTRELTIDQPIEEAFALLSEPDRMGDWLPYVWKCEYVGGGPMHKGTRINSMIGTEASHKIQQSRVSAFEPPHLFALTSHQMGVEATYTWQLAEFGTEATHVTLRVECTGPWWMRPFLPLIGKAMEATDGTMLTWLKNAAEGTIATPD